MGAEFKVKNDERTRRHSVRKAGWDEKEPLERRTSMHFRELKGTQITAY